MTQEINDGRFVEEFDIHAPSYGERTTAAEADLRGKCPVAWTNNYGGHWNVSGYHALADGLRDRDRFSAEKYTDEDGTVKGGITIPTVEGYRALPNESDPPYWDIYRKAIARHLAPGAIEKRRPLIQRYATEVIDHMIEHGEADFTMEVGSPVTALITLDIVGFPLEDWRVYADAIHRTFTADPGNDSGDHLGPIRDKILDAVVARRPAPLEGDDRRLIDELVSMPVDGHMLDDNEVQDLIYDIFVGGFDTTAGLLAGTLKYLEHKPEVKQQLIDDEDYLKTATEEFLRFISPAVGLGKTATTDIELEGQTIRAGEKMWFMYRAANWDPAEFPDPEVVDLERMPNRHFAFGAGIHRCVGSNLARAVFQIVLVEFLTRIPDYKIDHERVQMYRYASTNAGTAFMPISYTPGPRVASERILEKL